MTVEKLYTYVGTNGTITSPVYLPEVPAIVKLRARPAAGKTLVHVNGATSKLVITTDEDLNNWKEVDD